MRSLQNHQKTLLTPFGLFVAVFPHPLDEIVFQDVRHLQGMVDLHGRVDAYPRMVVKLLAGLFTSANHHTNVICSEMVLVPCCRPRDHGRSTNRGKQLGCCEGAGDRHSARKEQQKPWFNAVEKFRRIQEVDKSNVKDNRQLWRGIKSNDGRNILVSSAT